MLTQRPKREYHHRGENEYQHQGPRGGQYSVNERTRMDSISERRIRLTLFSLAQLGPCLFDCIGSGNRNTDDDQVPRAGVLERNNLGRAPGADGPSRKGEAVG